MNSISNFFAVVYETWFNIYNQNFTVVHTALYDNSSYFWIGISSLIIPLVVCLIFYFIWMFPYGKWYHWLIWMLASSVIVLCSTIGISNLLLFASNNPILDNAYGDTPTYDYASSLPIRYAICNFFIAFVIGFIFSIICKQISKIQTHLPF